MSKNLFNKTLFGVGYIGEGKHKSFENGKITKKYSTWSNMLKRCYDEKYNDKKTTYKSCIVDDNWHNFQIFAEWYEISYYQIDGEIMCLDKDILIKGNKVYSPRTCIFVPLRINNLFIKRDSKRGELPVSVYWNNYHKKYSSECGNRGKNIKLGYFDSKEEAFQVYKIHKEKLIKHVADEYKDLIPIKLYKAMVNYRVEFND